MSENVHVSVYIGIAGDTGIAIYFCAIAHPGMPRLRKVFLTLNPASEIALADLEVSDGEGPEGNEAMENDFMAV